MRLHSRKAPCGVLPILATLAAVTAAPGVRADGLTLDRYSASETVRDGFQVSRPVDTGHMSLDVTLHLDYANDPLVLETTQGDADSESSRVVSDQLAAKLGFSFGLWSRLVAFAGFSGNVLMRGEDYIDPTTLQVANTADGPGLGDAQAGVRFRVLGEEEDAFALATQLTGSAPLGKWASRNQNYSGDASGTVLPELLGELRLFGLRATANLGAKVRRNVDLGGVTAGDEFLYALGITAPLMDSALEATVEGFGSSTLQDFGKRETTAIEVLGGARYTVRPLGLTFGLAGGPGLTRGVGAPDFRIVAMVGYQILGTKKPPEKPVAAAAPTDLDGDGLLDSQDACPSDPEDADGFEDEDGCPDLDNDADGVADTTDKCPLEAEDVDKFEDEDGCPDLDNDADGIADTTDKCPLEAEDVDKFEDKDGCPDLDNDADGVPDSDDECPYAPGAPEAKGCPKSVRINVETGEISILQQVQFSKNKAEILAESFPLLTEVRDTLNANPQLESVRVEGHTDSRGVDNANMDLSKRRATSVVRWLTTAGVTADRLHPFGCGETKPIADNETAEGRQENRRVVFQVIENTSPESPAADACQASDIR